MENQNTAPSLNAEILTAFNAAVTSQTDGIKAKNDELKAEISAIKTDFATQLEAKDAAWKAQIEELKNSIPQPKAPDKIPATVKTYKGVFTDGDAAHTAALFMLSLKSGREGELYTKKLHDKGVKTLFEGSTAGDLVPEQYLATLVDLIEQYGIYGQLSTRVAMGSETLKFPKKTARGTAYWIGEGSAGTATNFTTQTITLAAKKVMGLTKMSEEANEDSMLSLVNVITQDLAQDIAYALDNALINGDGTSTYGGIVGMRSKLLAVDGTIGNIAGLYVGTGNAYSELTLNDFISVTGLLRSMFHQKAQFLMSRTVWAQAQKVIGALGGVSATEAQNGLKNSLWGYPVLLTECMPLTAGNSQICALFGDFQSGVYFGDRQAITMAQTNSNDTDFEKDLITIKGTVRCDFNVHDVGNTTTTGAIVGLITASS